MANLKLVSSEYNSVALYYILTSIEDVATNGAVIDGNVPLVSGALAYDRDQNIYCYDGELWTASNGEAKISNYALTTIGTSGAPVTINTVQYMTYDFGGWIFQPAEMNEDPTQWDVAHILYDGKWYNLEKHTFTWGVEVPYFGAEPSGTYPALAFDFSVYPFAVANLNGDVALVVPADLNNPAGSEYNQKHIIYGYANTNE